MIADYMSKPVQGKLFHTFRNVIMGWAHISTLFDAFSSNEERVGDNGNLTDNGNLPVLPIEPKARKLTYAETTKVSLAVNEQNKLIANRIDPIA
jgi:hypothetical protein